MSHVVGYHRPASVEEALAALAAPGTPKLIIAGGTTVNADPNPDPVEVVDLQALRLGGIGTDGDRLRVGATTTLESLATDERTPTMLAKLTRREAPSTLRAMGTIGGLVVVADPESELLAGLLVHEATVTIVDSSGSTDHDLAAVLANGPGAGIITAVTFDRTGTTASARTGRTPADRPIVAAVARKKTDGTVLTALCGVAGTPVLVDDPGGLEPPGDFRGSPTYRRHIAQVLAGRVRKQVS
ncbi:MAG TPA: FAD binding domain-containing protein [Acidimicrobiia bacterium]|nr:FAD binding domain-containing protein [Acidimicrobiia bacterium]